ncbi:MAG TPA: hypothetical protein VKV35_09875 [Streptosporangiaceae bacterium]|jgi:hypothetical protein|nr:hypothetical protein [Streptosporangiaceae bacterium]
MSQAARWFAAARAGYGLALVGRPGRAVRLAQGSPADGRARAVTRVLGARHLIQAAVTAARPGPRTLALGAGADAAHAASMLALAAAGPRRRHAALTDAAVAAAFAAAGTALSRETRDDRPR